MKRFTLPTLPLLFALALGCSDDSGGDNTPDASTLKRYGQACTADKDCNTGLCAAKTCSVTCTKPTECPTVDGKRFYCGEVSTGKTACYPQVWDGKKAGTMGTSCASTGKCEADHFCTGQPGDADRYCAGKCTTDTDCPPEYRCATTRTGKDAASTTSYCYKRQFCHPCTGDWQCAGAGWKCLKDKLGNGFCSKPCSAGAAAPDAGTGDAAPGGTCPTYATCEKEGSAYFCKHKAGFCTRGFKSEGGHCDPCIVHGWLGTGVSSDPVSTVAEAKQCKGSAFCVMYDRYYGESACLKTCTDDASCGDSKLKCYKYTTSLGTSVCRPWENYTTGGKTYQVPASCKFK